MCPFEFYRISVSIILWISARRFCVFELHCRVNWQLGQRLQCFQMQTFLHYRGGFPSPHRLIPPPPPADNTGPLMKMSGVFVNGWAVPYEVRCTGSQLNRSTAVSLHRCLTGTFTREQKFSGCGDEFNSQ